jgi:hypothetical protein
LLRSRHSRNSIRFAAAHILLAVVAFSAALASAIERHFDIPQQDLGSALTTLAKQADFQLIYSTQLVEGKISPAIHGTMTTEAALDRLIGPAGLRHEFLDPQTVMISAEPSPGQVNQPARRQAAASADTSQTDSRTTVPSPSSLPSVTVIAPPLPNPRDLQGTSVPKFITSHGKVETLTGQLARWYAGICPRTEGLTPELNAFVSERIQALASHIGLREQETVECERHKLRSEFALDPNVFIVFTRAPQKLLDAVAKHHYELLGFHYPVETKRLKAVKRPIQGWYVTATRGAGGDAWVDSLFGRVPPGIPNGRLMTGRRSFFVFALIVVDVDKVQGHTIGSLADYIAVLALSQAHSLDDCSHLASVIDLFSAACGPDSRRETVTAGDIAYLKALYRVNPGERPFLETADIQQMMLEQLRPH